MTNHERSSYGAERKNDQTKDRKIGKKTIRNYAIVAGVVVALGAGGALVYSNLSHNASNTNNSSQHETQNTPEQPQRESIENLTANYKFNMPNEQGIINQFEMPSGMSDQEAAETFVSRYNSWMSFGINEDFDKIANRLGDDETEEHLVGLIATTTKDAAKPIQKGLFYADVMGSAGDDFAKEMQEINTSSVELYAKTIKDTEPYKRTLKAMDTATGEDVSWNLTDVRLITFTVLERTNADKNSSAEKGADANDQVNRRGTATIKLYDDGKTTKIVSSPVFKWN